MLQFLAQRRGAGDGNLERLELVRYCRALSNEQVDGRHREEEGDLVLCVVLEELREVEARHPVHGATHVERIDEVALDAGNVSRGEMRNGAVFKVWPGRFEPSLEHVAR